MSRVTPSAADSDDETPPPGPGRKPPRADAPAVRLGIVRFTDALVALADTADARTACDTAAWPLCCDY